MFLPKIFDSGSIHSNIKTNSTQLKLLNKNLLCITCVRQRQHMRVQCPLNVHHLIYCETKLQLDISNMIHFFFNVYIVLIIYL